MFKEEQQCFCFDILIKVVYSTCSCLEGRDGLLQAGYCLSVTAGGNLRVEGTHVKENAGLLQRQVLLAHWHSCEGVIPERKKEGAVTYFCKARIKRIEKDFFFLKDKIFNDTQKSNF